MQRTAYCLSKSITGCIGELVAIRISEQTDMFRVRVVVSQYIPAPLRIKRGTHLCVLQYAVSSHMFLFQLIDKSISGWRADMQCQILSLYWL